MATWSRITPLVACALLAAACSGSGADPRDDPTPVPNVVTGVGQITLTIWETPDVARDWEGELGDAFTARFPNVTVTRVSKPFDRIVQALRRAPASPSPSPKVDPEAGVPDLIRVRPGADRVGVLVRERELAPLDGYVAGNGWGERSPAALAGLNRFTAAGARADTGSVYGVAATGRMTGIYYNKTKLIDLNLPVPTTWAGVTSTVTAAVDAGETPIQFGTTDAGAIADVYGMLTARFAGPETGTALAYGRDGAVWGGDGDTAAATELLSLYGGLTARGSSADAAQRFAAGDGVFLIASTDRLADLQRDMGADVGFLAPPPLDESADPVTSGELDASWSITAAAAHPDVAAAYLDYVTGPDAARVLARVNALPLLVPNDATAPAGTAQAEVMNVWRSVVGGDRLVPLFAAAPPEVAGRVDGALRAMLRSEFGPEQLAAHLKAATD